MKFPNWLESGGSVPLLATSARCIGPYCPQLCRRVSPGQSPETTSHLNFVALFFHLTLLSRMPHVPFNKARAVLSSIVHDSSSLHIIYVTYFKLLSLSFSVFSHFVSYIFPISLVQSFHLPNTISQWLTFLVCLTKYLHFTIARHFWDFVFWVLYSDVPGCLPLAEEHFIYCSHTACSLCLLKIDFLKCLLMNKIFSNRKLQNPSL